MHIVMVYLKWFICIHKMHFIHFTVHLLLRSVKVKTIKAAINIYLLEILIVSAFNDLLFNLCLGK